MKKLFLLMILVLLTATIAIGYLYKTAKATIAQQTIQAQLDSRGLVDLRAKVQVDYELNENLKTNYVSHDSSLGILNDSELSMNERIICDSLSAGDKRALFSDFDLSFVQKQLLKIIYSLRKDEQACRVFLSRMHSTDKQVISAYATSQVYLDSPLANLTHCGLLKLFVLSNLKTDKLRQQIQPSKSCEVTDIGVEKSISRHPLNQAIRYPQYTNSSEISMSALVNTVDGLQQDIITLEQSLNDNLLIDVSVINVDTGVKVQYDKGYVLEEVTSQPDNLPMASVAKLFIARAVIDNDIYTENVHKHMKGMLCYSNKDSAKKLYEFSQGRARQLINEYDVNTFSNIPRVVLTTENQGISTNNLQDFLQDFAYILWQNDDYLANSLEEGCTASAISLPDGYKIMFAKTGTAFVTPKVKAKLLTIAYQNAQGVPYVLLIRMNALKDKAICMGDGCFDNAKLQGLVTTLAESNI